LMRENTSLSAAVDLINASSQVAILAHISPDGDTLGSSLALMLGLRQIGKKAQVFCDDSLPTNLAFLPRSDEVRTSTRLPSDTDLIVLVDASSVDRFGSIYADNSDVFSRAKMLNIDHHTTNQYFGDVNVVDVHAAATGESVLDLLELLGANMTIPIATCILTALVTDTRAFRTPSTTPRTLATAARLFDLGAPLPLIMESVYRSRSLSTLRLWGLALERLRVMDGIVWTEITDDMQALASAQPWEGDGIIDLLASLRQIKVAVLFKQTSDGIKVSLRATDGVDVAEAAVRFGGGGHPRAAGCVIPGRLESVERQVLRYLAQKTGAS
jgi:bifunctional oligoribonuclease and PAP phosphatase NrnA